MSYDIPLIKREYKQPYYHVQYEERNQGDQDKGPDINRNQERFHARLNIAQVKLNKCQDQILSVDKINSKNQMG